MADESSASIREVHALLDAAETKLSAQISDLKREMLLQFERHDITHKDEERSRRSRLRWVVTTALTVGGLVGGFLGHLIEQVLK
jgi:uncharacterized membrane protein